MSLTRIVESFRMEKSRMHVFYIFTLKYIFALKSKQHMQLWQHLSAMVVGSLFSSKNATSGHASFPIKYHNSCTNQVLCGSIFFFRFSKSTKKKNPNRISIFSETLYICVRINPFEKENHWRYSFFAFFAFLLLLLSLNVFDVSYFSCNSEIGASLRSAK